MILMIAGNLLCPSWTTMVVSLIHEKIVAYRIKKMDFLLLGKTSDEFAPIAGPGNWNVSFKIEIFRT